MHGTFTTYPSTYLDVYKINSLGTKVIVVIHISTFSKFSVIPYFKYLSSSSANFILAKSEGYS